MRDPVKETTEAINSGEVTAQQIADMMRGRFGTTKINALVLSQLPTYFSAFDGLRERNKAQREEAAGPVDFRPLFAIVEQALAVLGEETCREIIRDKTGEATIPISLPGFMRAHAVNRTIAALQGAIARRKYHQARCEGEGEVITPHGSEAKVCAILREGGKQVFPQGHHVAEIYVRNGEAFVTYTEGKA